MSVESATEVQDGEAFAAIREAVGPDAEITSIDALTTEITAVIDGTSSLHQQDVVVGEVADYGVSPTDNVHFKLVHRKKGRKNSKDDRLHCIISDDQRADITTSIRDGKRVAVTGALTFYAPRSRCSIEVDDVVPADGDDSSHPFERLRTDHRIQIVLAAVLLLLVGLLASSLLLL